MRAEHDFSAQVAGYPGKGTGLMAEEVFADASSWYGVYNVNSVLGVGACGGPLLHTGSNGVISVAGVLSSGNSSNTSSTYAALFSDASWNWLQGAMAANDYLVGPSFPTSVATARGMIFTGGACADSLVGGSGWDTFFGHAGNDVLEGGGGIDTATFTGLRCSYSVVAAGGAITVTDSLPSRDGVDSLRNIERVKFADFALAFDFSGSAGQAHRLYQAALGRSPDKSGLGYQINILDSGVGLVQVAGHFIASPEFASRYGGLSDLSFVNQLYTNILGRLGDRPGSTITRLGLQQVRRERTCWLDSQSRPRTRFSLWDRFRTALNTPQYSQGPRFSMNSSALNCTDLVAVPAPPRTEPRIELSFTACFG